MGVEPVVTQADAEADGEPVEDERDEQIGPAEVEERRHGQYVEIPP